MSDDRYIELAMAKRRLTKAAQTLLGICTGLTADGRLDDQEIRFLNVWLADHAELASTWPGDILTARLASILADGIITEDERASLFDTIQFLCGTDFESTGSAMPIAAAAPFDDPDQVVFSSKSFCLTGEFFFGPRAACVQRLADLGAEFHSNVTGKTDYLVVGGQCNPNWANTTYGRKIETAIERKKRYGKPAIISEEIWVHAMQAISS